MCVKSKKWIAFFLVVSIVGNLLVGFNVKASEPTIEVEEPNDVEIETDNELKQDDENLDEEDILQEGDELTEIEEEITDTETVGTETADDSSEGTGQAQINNISLNSVDAEQNVSLAANTENIASGVIDEDYGQITWEIDNSGKLTVTGTGDVISPNNRRYFPWDDYCESITSAVISVTGMTISANMFYNCWNMTQIDLSNFDTSQITDMGRMFQGCISLTALDLSNFNTSNVTNMNAMFEDCYNLKELDLSSFDTSKVTGMSSMFMRCSSLENLNLKNFNTNNVTAMEQMFYECSSLKELDLSNFSTRNVTFMRQMFQDCSSLISLNISSFNTSYITDMSSLFNGCSSLKSIDVSNFDTSSVEDMSFMFYGCKSLSSLDLSDFVTNKVQSMCGMFCDCESLTDLDINSFDTSSVTDMSGMFQNCKSLNSLDLYDFDTSKVFSMEEMFLGCENLTKLDLSNFDTSQVWSMNLMFFNCKNLGTLDVSNFDTGNVSGIGGMFYGCSSLKTLDLSKFDLSNIIEFDESYDGFFWDDHREEAVYASLIFGECNNLEVIKCPINVSLPITLPGSDGDVWKQNDGTVITELPKNLSNSIAITKNGATAETGYAQIISLTPENGAQDVGFDASNVPYFQITFDREISSIQADNNRIFANLNFDAGTIKVFRSSDNELIYEVTYDDYLNDMYQISGTTSGDITVIDSTTLRLDPLNAHILLEPDTDYYITIDEGFIQFVDGSVNYAIKKDEWKFKTEATSVVYAPLLKKNGKFHYVTCEGNDYGTYDYSYDEAWFFNNSYIYQHDLTRMSIRTAMAAFGTSSSNPAENIKELMTDLGFSYSDDSIRYPTPTNYSIGYAIGSKNILSDSGEKCSLVLVAIRGAGYGVEWGGNFQVGTGMEHDNFSSSATAIRMGLNDYIEKNKETLDKNIKVWIVGYSRAAATANLLARQLDDGEIDSVLGKNVYAFCFECPQTTTSTTLTTNEKYSNITNIVNPIDFVPKVPMSAWGFGRYGTTYYLPSSDTTSNYELLKNTMVKKYDDILQYNESENWKGALYASNEKGQASILDSFMSNLANAVGSQENYYLNHQTNMVQIAARTLGGGGGILGNTYYFINEVIKLTDLVAKSPLNTAKTVSLFTKNYGAYAHYPELCLSWIDSLNGKYSGDQYRIVYINCPVDVQVFDSEGELVAFIATNEVQEISDSYVYSYIDDNEQKIIILPYDEEYKIELTATDDGKVNYAVADYSLAAGRLIKKVNYYDITMEKGEILNGIIENIETGIDAKYPLYKNGDILVSEVENNIVNYYTVRVKSEGTGVVTGGGKFSVGEFVKVTATSNGNAKFLGWYNEKGDCVSQNLEYRFVVKENITLIGKFGNTNAENNTNVDIDYQTPLTQTENTNTISKSETILNVIQSANTGDETPVELFVIVLFNSLTIACFIYYKWRRSRHSN